MKDVLTLLFHLLTTIAKLIGPGGARAVIADSLLMKQQLLVMSRTRQRAPINEKQTRGDRRNEMLRFTYRSAVRLRTNVGSI